MPDKRLKQTHLADSMPTPQAEKTPNIDRLVSLTYDNDPEVRRRVARQLGGINESFGEYLAQPITVPFEG